MALGQSTVHKYMHTKLCTVIAQISLKLWTGAVCLKIRYVLRDLTTKCNMMFGKSEPLSQKPIYFFTSDSIKFSRSKIAFLWRVLKLKKKKNYLVSFASILLDYVTGLSCEKLQRTNGRVLSKMYVYSFEMKSYQCRSNYSVDIQFSYYHSCSGWCCSVLKHRS